MIPIFRPCFDEEEVAAVREVMLSGWVGAGPRAEEFEKKFAEYVGTKHAVSVNSCSSALLLALMVLDVEGKEVLTTSMTFIATNHAILQSGATPVFCDIDAETLNMDPSSIAEQITDNTAAIMVVHHSGHPCDMDPILEMAAERNIPVVEDAAHACGSYYDGRTVGSLGKIGCFSFQAQKNLTTCDGGMLTTDDSKLAERLKRLSWMGISKATWDRFKESEGQQRWRYDITEVGYKFYMNDLSAAIGLVQLGKLESANAQRREIATQYNKAFSALSWLRQPVIKPYARTSQHAYVPRVEDRDGLINHLHAQEIDASVHYYPNHLYPIYLPYSRNLPVTDTVWEELITLPLFPSMTDQEVNQVVEAVKSFQPNGRTTAASG
jgi:perosamine synthetase